MGQLPVCRKWEIYIRAAFGPLYLWVISLVIVVSSSTKGGVNLAFVFALALEWINVLALNHSQEFDFFTGN